jgi:hypothetical protein
VGRRVRVRGVVALGALLGTLLLCGGSASAKTVQTIMLQEPSGAVVGASFTEPAESSVGLEVTLTAETPSVCILSYFGKEATGGKPSWTITLIEGGTCTITATQAGDAEYEAAEARLSFTVSGPRRETGNPLEHPSRKPPADEALRREALRVLRAAFKVCKKDKSLSERGACKERARTRYRDTLYPPAPHWVCRARDTQCPTLIVHVYGYGGEGPGPGPGGAYVLEGQRLRIVRLGPSGRATNGVETSRHRLRLTPGAYEVTAETGGPSSKSTAVVVRAGETREVTIKLSIK